MEPVFLKNNPIVPVVVLKRVEDTLPMLGALSRGGINTAEITFRTDCAAEAIRLAVSAFPDMTIGAGTVLNGRQCDQAAAAGAKFIVSPGFCDEAAEFCARRGLPYLPGVATATEIMRALANGLSTLKFFPAGAMGGIKTLKALSAAFPQVGFVPTGGVSEENMAEYLSLGCVRAVGGSFMMKGTALETEEASRRAAAIAKEIL